jgi:hypothetical protein
MKKKNISVQDWFIPKTFERVNYIFEKYSSAVTPHKTFTLEVNGQTSLIESECADDERDVLVKFM